MKESINKKTIIIVSAIILFLIICIFVLKSISKNNGGFLLLDDYLIEYSENGIKTANIDDVKNYKFKMIYDDSYIGDYKFDHKDEIHNRLLFKSDDGVNALKLPLLGLDNNTSLIDFEVKKMDNNDFNLFVATSGANVNFKLSDLSYAKKVIIDDISIYTIKYEGEKESDDYSMIFISKGDKSYVLDEDFPTKEDGGYLFYSFDIMYVLDINKDDKYEIVVSKSYYDVTDYSIYELDDDFLELYYTGK